MDCQWYLPNTCVCAYVSDVSSANVEHEQGKGLDQFHRWFNSLHKKSLLKIGFLPKSDSENIIPVETQKS